MALIHVFNGINEKTSYTFNGSLRANIPGIDWNNSIILKGGYRIDPDYEVKENDVIYVRKTPGALVATALTVVAVTAIVVAGIYEGVTIYQNKKTQAALEEANKKAKAAQDQSSKLPFIRGARNQPATGRTFPYMLGKSLMTPYRLCPAHYTIAGTRGSEQYYNVVLEVAYNNLVFDKIKMGETVIKQFTGTTPQDGVYSFDAGTYYDERNIIEIKQTGAFTNDDFNKKIICTELSTEIPHKHASSDPTENAKIEAEWRAGVVQELPTNAQSVELIALFDGLQKYTDSWQADTITLSPQWANVDNPSESDWHDFTTGFFAVLIASPCTGPFMGAAIGYAFMQNNFEMYAVFTFLALGYALPFALAEIYPHFLQRLLPKPGAWMKKLKTILALPILLTCVWLASVLVAQIYSKDGINKNNLDWHPYNAEEIQQEISAGNKVFIDFTAEWCLTCMFNEKTRLNSRKFADFVKDNQVVLFKADLTESNEEYNEALSSYGRDGIPVYIYYQSNTYRILPIFFSIDDLTEEK